MGFGNRIARTSSPLLVMKPREIHFHQSIVKAVQKISLPPSFAAFFLYACIFVFPSY